MLPSSSSSSSSCVLLLLLATGVSCVITDVIPLEGDEYLFNCGGYGDLQYFLLHQEGVALVPQTYDSLEITVFRNATVYFKSIKVEHQGTHLCMRHSGGEQKGFPTPLKVRPHPPEDLWGEVYQAKFVTGFLAALVIGTLFVLGCAVHKYRWRPAGNDTQPIITSNAYINPAMIGDDAESACSTKM